MNDTITISVIQDHILRPSTTMKKESEFKEKDINLPIRLILGRKSLKKERLKTHQGKSKVEVKEEKKKKNQLKFISGIKTKQAKRQETIAQKIAKKSEKVGFRKSEKRRQKVIGNTQKKEKVSSRVKLDLSKINPNLKSRRKGVVFSSGNIKNGKKEPEEESDDDDQSGDIDEVLMKSAREKAEDNDYNEQYLKKRSPFDSTIPGLKLSRSEIKYVAGKGQSKENSIHLE